MKRHYYAFVGSPATYGMPHPTTGRLNAHGKLFCFDTKKERDEFCDDFNHEFNQYPRPTNKKEAKVLYFGGMSNNQFEEMLAALQAKMLEWI